MMFKIFSIIFLATLSYAQIGIFDVRTTNIGDISKSSLMQTACCQELTKDLTMVQKTTLYSFLAYGVWELAVQTLSPEANIRVDLVLIYPALAILTGWSIADWIAK